jgi:mono/diheme cytochrome c family protein
MRRRLRIPAALMLVGLVMTAYALEDQKQDTAGHAAPAREVALEIGRRLFLERCASCHNARGDKPLADGPPLNRRKLSREVIERNVAGRFKKATKDEKRAVTLCIESLMKPD